MAVQARHFMNGSNDQYEFWSRRKVNERRRSRRSTLSCGGAFFTLYRVARRIRLIAAILAVKPRARARDRDRNKSAMTPQCLDYEWTAGRSHEPAQTLMCRRI